MATSKGDSEGVTLHGPQILRRPRKKGTRGANVMSRWLYQMSERSWSIENYRRRVKEGNEVRWPTRKRMFAHEAPAAGDIVIFLFAPTACDTPGICGFGVITKYLPKTRKFDWLPLPPTNVLKKRPWWGRSSAGNRGPCEGTVSAGHDVPTPRGPRQRSSARSIRVGGGLMRSRRPRRHDAYVGSAWSNRAIDSDTSQARLRER